MTISFISAIANVYDILCFQDECESDEELPSASSILGKKTVIDLSDEGADQLEPTFPVIPPTILLHTFYLLVAT